MQKESDATTCSPCPICQEAFDLASKRPKALNCCHSMCAECLQCMVQAGNRTVCPECRSGFEYEEVMATDNQEII